MSKYSYTKGSSNVVNSSSQKHSFVYDQTESCDNKIRIKEDILSLSKPNFPCKEFCLDTQEKLHKSGKIQGIYRKQKLGHSVSAPPTAFS